MKLKRSVFTQRLTLGKKRLKVKIDGEKAIVCLTEAAREVSGGADPAAVAAQLFTDIFGVEAAREILAFYGGKKGEAAQRLIPLLLGRVLKKAARCEKIKQKARAKALIS